MDIEERLAGVVKELSYLRGVVEQMDKRINDLVHRIDRLRVRIDKVEDRMSRLEDRMSSQFRWIIGILISIWSSTIALLIAILLKLIGLF